MFDALWQLAEGIEFQSLYLSPGELVSLRYLNANDKVPLTSNKLDSSEPGQAQHDGPFWNQHLFL